MRCEEVTRELANPTGTLASAPLAEHLASCPSCASWSRSAASLDRIWAETRPADPSPEALDALWLKVSSTLDTIPFVPQAPARPRRRRWAYTALGVALVQAAAVLLLMVSWKWQGNWQGGDQIVKVKKVDPVPARPVMTLPDLTVEFGQMKVVHIDNNGHHVETHDENSSNRSTMGDNTPFDAMNGAESMANAWKVADNAASNGVGSWLQ